MYCNKINVKTSREVGSAASVKSDCKNTCHMTYVGVKASIMCKCCSIPFHKGSYLALVHVHIISTM